MTTGPRDFDPRAELVATMPEAGTVRVWRASTGADADLLARCAELLPDYERERAARLRVPAKRCEYVIAQALLRRLLGAALGEQPRSIRFDRGHKGKPYLAPPWAASGIQFNITHTSGQVMVAVTLDREVGIDCEFLRDDVARDKIVRRHFRAGEQEAYFALRPELRTAAFFRAWTGKEALLKALGAGIGGGLSNFGVTLAPGEPPAVTHAAERYGGASQWALTTLAAGPGHAASLAAAGASPIVVVDATAGAAAAR